MTSPLAEDSGTRYEDSGHDTQFHRAKLREVSFWYRLSRHFEPVGMMSCVGCPRNFRRDAWPVANRAAPSHGAVHSCIGLDDAGALLALGRAASEICGRDTFDMPRPSPYSLGHHDGRRAQTLPGPYRPPAGSPRALRQASSGTARRSRGTDGSGRRDAARGADPHAPCPRWVVELAVRASVIAADVLSFAKTSSHSVDDGRCSRDRSRNV